jgi:hypothetical protein
MVIAGSCGDAMIFGSHVRDRRELFVTVDSTAFVESGRRAKLEAMFGTRIMTVAEFELYCAGAPEAASHGQTPG